LKATLIFEFLVIGSPSLENYNIVSLTVEQLAMVFYGL
jgi:hypothetical protein